MRAKCVLRKRELTRAVISDDVTKFMMWQTLRLLTFQVLFSQRAAVLSIFVKFLYFSSIYLTKPLFTMGKKTFKKAKDTTSGGNGHHSGRKRGRSDDRDLDSNVAGQPLSSRRRIGKYDSDLSVNISKGEKRGRQIVL